MSIKSKLISGTAAVVLFAVILVSLPIILRERNTQQRDISDAASYMQQVVYSEVEGFLAGPAATLDAMLEYARTQELDREVITPYLAGLAATNPDFQYVYYVDSVPYSQGGFLADNLHLDIPDDYDQTTRGWFKAAAASNGYIVTEPYMDIMVGGVVITIAKRLYINGQFRGVAAIDIALDKIVNFIGNFSLSKNGSSYILNQNGLYITNEDSKKVLEANFFDDIKKSSLLNEIKNQKEYFSIDIGSGQYLIVSALPEVTGWYFASIGPSKDLVAAIYANIRFSIIVAVLCVLLALAIGVIISRQIVKPISEVAGAVKGIAEGNADLTYRLKAKGNDEVGELVKGFNAFMEKLQSIIAVMKKSKDSLIEAGTDLHSGMSETSTEVSEILENMHSMENNISNQDSSVQQTAGAVNEILANIQSMEQMVHTQADGVSTASSAVEQMIGNISSVNQSVDKMSHSFGELIQSSNEGGRALQGLSDTISQMQIQSQSLGEANVAISNIASQTNLLAMNAAIEAAHAGEAGKGFAVVADEIRKLSETSSTQSKTIGEQLKNIQGTISSVASTAQNGMDAFSALASRVQETDEIVRQIKSAMEEQNEGSKQIIEVLHNMNDSTTEVRNASQEMAEGSKAILKEVHELQDSTASIKSGMNQTSLSADAISKTSETLAQISSRMESSITDIGNQVDQFEV